MNYSNSNYSIITIDSNSNSSHIEESNLNLYDDKLIMGLIYFGVSFIFGLPILMILMCVYKMRGDPPCNNVKQACCCDFC